MSVVPRILTHNASLKLLALLGAVFLWAIVPRNPQGGEVLPQVPVRVQVADLDWVQAGAPEPTMVQVRLAGPTREIIRLAREGTTVRVPMDRVTSTDTVVSLRRDWVVLAGAPGVVVEEIVPGSVRLAFEEARSRSLPIAVPTEGRLPPGLALAAPLGVNPVLARVRGPARLVDPLTSIPLRPLRLSEVRASGIVELPVDTSGLGSMLVTPQRASVGVRVETAEERVVEGVAVRVADAPAFEVVVRPDSVTLRLAGAPARLASAPLEQIRPIVDGRRLLGLAPGEARRVPVTLLEVPGLISARAVPDSVTVQRPAGPGGPRP
ncbi:MAG: hypothetical protein RQ751_13465 [Longimicrobiales bacterium]|nr:hypothetical protein [Longimicrobiales bacterium]